MAARSNRRQRKKNRMRSSIEDLGVKLHAELCATEAEVLRLSYAAHGSFEATSRAEVPGRRKSGTKPFPGFEQLLADEFGGHCDSAERPFVPPPAGGEGKAAHGQRTVGYVARTGGGFAPLQTRLSSSHVRAKRRKAGGGFSRGGNHSQHGPPTTLARVWSKENEERVRGMELWAALASRTHRTIIQRLVLLSWRRVVRSRHAHRAAAAQCIVRFQGMRGGSAHSGRLWSVARRCFRGWAAEAKEAVQRRRWGAREQERAVLRQLRLQLADTQGALTEVQAALAFRSRVLGKKLAGMRRQLQAAEEGQRQAEARMRQLHALLEGEMDEGAAAGTAVAADDARTQALLTQDTVSAPLAAAVAASPEVVPGGAALTAITAATAASPASLPPLPATTALSGLARLRGVVRGVAASTAAAAKGQGQGQGEAASPWGSDRMCVELAASLAARLLREIEEAEQTLDRISVLCVQDVRVLLSPQERNEAVAEAVRHRTSAAPTQPQQQPSPSPSPAHLPFGSGGLGNSSSSSSGGGGGSALLCLATPYQPSSLTSMCWRAALQLPLPTLLLRWATYCLWLLRTQVLATPDQSPNPNHSGSGSDSGSGSGNGSAPAFGGGHTAATAAAAATAGTIPHGLPSSLPQPHLPQPQRLTDFADGHLYCALLLLQAQLQPATLRQCAPAPTLRASAVAAAPAAATTTAAGAAAGVGTVAAEGRGIGEGGQRTGSSTDSNGSSRHSSGSNSRTSSGNGNGSGNGDGSGGGDGGGEGRSPSTPMASAAHRVRGLRAITSSFAAFAAPAAAATAAATAAAAATATGRSVATTAAAVATGGSSSSGGGSGGVESPLSRQRRLRHHRLLGPWPTYGFGGAPWPQHQRQRRRIHGGSGSGGGGGDHSGISSVSAEGGDGDSAAAAAVAAAAVAALGNNSIAAGASSGGGSGGGSSVDGDWAVAWRELLRAIVRDDGSEATPPLVAALCCLQRCGMGVRALLPPSLLPPAAPSLSPAAATTGGSPTGGGSGGGGGGGASDASATGLNPVLRTAYAMPAPPSPWQRIAVDLREGSERHSAAAIAAADGGGEMRVAATELLQDWVHLKLLARLFLRFPALHLANSKTADNIAALRLSLSHARTAAHRLTALPDRYRDARQRHVTACNHIRLLEATERIAASARASAHAAATAAALAAAASADETSGGKPASAAAAAAAAAAGGGGPGRARRRRGGGQQADLAEWSRRREAADRLARLRLRRAEFASELERCGRTLGDVTATVHAAVARVRAAERETATLNAAFQMLVGRLLPTASAAAAAPQAQQQQQPQAAVLGGGSALEEQLEATGAAGGGPGLHC